MPAVGSSTIVKPPGVAIRLGRMDELFKRNTGSVPVQRALEPTQKPTWLSVEGEYGFPGFEERRAAISLVLQVWNGDLLARRSPSWP